LTINTDTSFKFEIRILIYHIYRCLTPSARSTIVGRVQSNFLVGLGTLCWLVEWRIWIHRVF